jgi:hypothetical protein
MEDATAKIAKNLERFTHALAVHDRENPSHTAFGIGLSYFDLERLALEEGEEILPGIKIYVDGGVSGNFRILCDGEHSGGEEAEGEEEELVVAILTPEMPLILPDGEDVRHTPSQN